MMKDDKTNLSRRSALKRFALLGGMAALPTLAVSRSAFAAKASQQAMQYQETPKNGEDCAACMHFIPPKSGGKMGTCKVVAGDISPKGWCIAFAPKQG